MNRRTFIGHAAVFVAGLSTRALSKPGADNIKLKVGNQFVFRTVKSGAAQAASFESSRGLAFVPPLPSEQTVAIIGQKQCSTGPCLVLQATRTLPPFVPGSKDRSYSEKVTAHIDKDTGNVSDIKTTILIDGSISNSSESSMDRDSTLVDFYGPWMLDLKNDYARARATGNGIITTLKVTGHEKVMGRDCFVVKQTQKLSSGQQVESTIWVDALRRIAVRINRAGNQMQLVR
ncbi:MAG: hypothetical protein L0229_21520 [Blastocatellia bacterium]|nr:hypothetical protein [Blastocatellia bacterium]